jgi:hypothetical protein
MHPRQSSVASPRLSHLTALRPYNAAGVRALSRHHASAGRRSRAQHNGRSPRKQLSCACEWQYPWDNENPADVLDVFMMRNNEEYRSSYDRQRKKARLQAAETCSYDLNLRGCCDSEAKWHIPSAKDFVNCHAGDLVTLRELRMLCRPDLYQYVNLYHHVHACSRHLRSRRT